MTRKFLLCAALAVMSLAVSAFPTRLMNYAQTPINGSLWEGVCTSPAGDFGPIDSVTTPSSYELVLYVDGTGITLTENGIYKLGDSGLGLAIKGDLNYVHISPSGTSTRKTLTRTDYQGTAYNAGKLWVMGEKLSDIAANDTVRLESGSLTVSLIKLKEAFTSQKLLFSLKAALVSGGVPVKTVTLETSPAGGISIPSQVCSVHMQTDTVDFGQIKATGKTGEVGRRMTFLSLVCTAGSDVTSTKATVTMKPGITFEGDTRAIGLTMSDGKTSGNLFVKAFSENAQSILCTSSEALTPESSAVLYDEKTGNVNERTGLSWLLCRKNSNRLPAGKFTGSATLTVSIE